MKKISIVRVTNGYIVRVLVTGLSVFNDPYEKGVYVFASYSALERWLDDNMQPKGAAEQ